MASNTIKLYNSLSQNKENFVPIDEGKVGMYVCGPTVYSHVHLGNVRTFLSFDLIYRYFCFLGYRVRYVRNITDVGHLENDQDEGDDKIAKRAKLEQLEPMEIVQKYVNYFHGVLQQFNILPPSIEPTATGHIVEQIEATKKLIDKGLAYEVDGSVYFDVKKYNEEENYGILSNRDIDQLLNQTRELEGTSDKKNPQDFALWKKASAQHIMQWNSPWGKGFPGWHIECTVMSTKYLGKQFDIHGGGMDLKFPHHECEIAQAQGLNNQKPVNYWLHANLLTLNGKKMSKSTGNTLLPDELISGENDFFEKPIHPMVLRFFMLQAHYRGVLDISNDALMAAEKAFARLMKSVEELKTITPKEKSTLDIVSWEKSCYDAMNDDFNSPILIAQLFEATKYINQLKENKESLSKIDLTQFKETIERFVYEVLGLSPIISEKEDTHLGKIEQVVKILIHLRNKARMDKDFTTSDIIRNQLSEIGIELKDGKEGTSFEINN